VYVVVLGTIQLSRAQRPARCPSRLSLAPRLEGALGWLRANRGLMVAARRGLHICITPQSPPPLVLGGRLVHCRQDGRFVTAAYTPASPPPCILSALVTLSRCGHALLLVLCVDSVRSTRFMLSVSSQARVVACLSTSANALRSATAHFLLRFSCPLRFIVPQCPPWNRLRPHGDRHSSGSRPSDPGDPARLSNPGPRHIQSHRVRRSVVFGHDDLPHLHYSPVLLNATSNPLALLLRTTETGR